MARHRRRRSKHRRASCLLCKPHKLTAKKKGHRAKADRRARQYELRAN